MKFIRFACVLALVFLACAAYASSEVPLEITLRADSLPGLGEEATFTATVTAYRDLPAVTVEIQLPDGARVVGDSSLTVANASERTPIEFQAKAVFTTPGLKSVRAVVKCAEKPGVVWSAVAYVMLDIGEASSSLITDTRGIRTPPKQLSKGSGKKLGRPSADKSTGKLGSLPESPASAELEQSKSLADYEPSTEDIVISGKWSFTDRAGSPIGQKNAQLELRKSGLYNVVLATAYTDWEGNFTFPAVTNTGVGLYVRCYTLSQGVSNLAAVRYNTSSDWYTADTDVYIFTQNGNQSIGDWCVDSSNPNYKAWWIVDDMAKAYMVPPDPVGGHVAIWSPASSGWAHYEVGGDIYLYSGDADDTPDTVLHEMGHSVMYNIYGDYMPDSPNCDPHSLLGDSSTGCAWSEGWAQIWHMWTTNDQYRNYPGGGYVDLEAATWGDGGDTGSDVEGRVAAAIWDITDTPNDGNDNYDGDWLDVWHIMYHHNCDKFSEFWSQWQSHNYNTHGAVACIYQNTIDWNTAPVMTPLPDMTLAEDEFRANAIDLDNYATDPESQDYQLQFTIANVSDPNLQIGINANHEVQVQGMPNWSGTASVMVSCYDGVSVIYDSFDVTVTPVNDPPVIQNVPDLSLSEDGSVINGINLYMHATDVESTPLALAYSITGNTNPSCVVTLALGALVCVNPVANWFGTSDVTICATDPQGGWDEDVFRITVNAVNDPPVITALPDRTLNEDATLNNTIDLWAYTTDPEIPASALTYTIQYSEMPDGAVTVDSNRYIDITPPANLFGQFYVVVRAWDFEGGHGDDTFKVTINSVPDPPVLKYIPDEMIETSAFATTRMVDLWKSASDPDGPDSELTFTVTGNTDTHITASIDSARSLKLIAPARWSGNSLVTVRATDPTGQWDEDTLSVIVGRNCETCSEAFGLADGAWVFFDRKTVTVSHFSAFYMEDDARVSGIRVNSTLNPDVDRYVTVAGQMTTHEGERAVDCTSYTLGSTDPTPPLPLGMTNKAMGGQYPSTNTPAVPAGRTGGLYNVGLLVRTTGTVVSRTSNSFWIDDGSRVPYSFSTHGLYVDCQPIVMYAPPLGSRVAVTGASGAGLVGGNTVNTLRLRDRADVKGMGGRVAFVYNTAASTAAVYAAILGNQGWNTTTLPLSGVASADLSGYDIIILGADTGTWSDSAKVNNIVNSDKSVIAMGDGGARFLDKVPDLYIGWLNSGGFMLRQGYVSDQGNVLYWFDNPITVPTDKILDTMVTTATTTCLYNPPAGVYGLLRHPTDSVYWTVAQQGRFMQWGYDTLPSNLNPVAKDLLVNCLYYMINRH